MSLLRIAKAPAVVMPPAATVMEAVERMQKANVGAVVVVEGNQLQGMFTERDVALRVVLEKKDPERTTLREVMSPGVVAVQKDTKADEAVKLMWERQVRHLPVVGENGAVAGVVEIRELFHEQFEELNQQLDSLEQYIAADGIGG